LFGLALKAFPLLLVNNSRASITGAVTRN